MYQALKPFKLKMEEHGSVRLVKPGDLVPEVKGWGGLEICLLRGWIGLVPKPPVLHPEELVEDAVEDFFEPVEDEEGYPGDGV